MSDCDGSMKHCVQHNGAGVFRLLCRQETTRLPSFRKAYQILLKKMYTAKMDLKGLLALQIFSITLFSTFHLSSTAMTSPRYHSKPRERLACSLVKMRAQFCILPNTRSLPAPPGHMRKEGPCCSALIKGIKVSGWRK